MKQEIAQTPAPRSLRGIRQPTTLPNTRPEMKHDIAQIPESQPSSQSQPATVPNALASTQPSSQSSNAHLSNSQQSNLSPMTQPQNPSTSHSQLGTPIPPSFEARVRSRWATLQNDYYSVQQSDQKGSRRCDLHALTCLHLIYDYEDKKLSLNLMSEEMKVPAPRILTARRYLLYLVKESLIIPMTKLGELTKTIQVPKKLGGNWVVNGEKVVKEGIYQAWKRSKAQHRLNELKNLILAKGITVSTLFDTTI